MSKTVYLNKSVKEVYVYIYIYIYIYIYNIIYTNTYILISMCHNDKRAVMMIWYDVGLYHYHVTMYTPVPRFFFPIWLGAVTEMRTQYVPAH